MPDSFANARKSVLTHLPTVISFCKEQHRFYPRMGFNDHARRLTGIETKLKGAIGPCLTIKDIESIESVRTHLMNHPDFQPQLTKFSHFAEIIARAVVIDRIATYDVNKMLNKYPLFASNSMITNDLLRELKTEPFSLRSLLAVMLIFASRKETFYYSPKAIFEEVQKVLNLSAVDIEEMFSMHAKVSRNTKFETDIEAIRICIAHSLFEIRKNGMNYSIHLENREKGFNFVKDFTHKEFYKFFSDYLLFERLLSLCLSISLNKAVMTGYLMK